MQSNRQLFTHTLYHYDLCWCSRVMTAGLHQCMLHPRLATLHMHGLGQTQIAMESSQPPLDYWLSELHTYKSRKPGHIWAAERN